ncbi:hypothetical protein ATO8_17655 [Roseivivax marinus]|uniref:TolA protein n=1 Tax=Roseivivax marinus TaxID=1379903 RepID=W4HEX4_9RHOB|nr:hypothetical protein [Roseivivax marinus]ETW11317.1 hypothetical protein ATO8_17655 [Roseivivax marinus]
MHTGHYISGGGHLALLLWVLFGSVFSSEPDAVEVREVSVVSEEEFAALTERAQPPESTVDVTAPPVPEAEAEAPPPASAPDPEPAPQPDPEPVPEPEPETAPEPVPPTPEADAQQETQELAAPAPEAAPQIDAPEASDRPTPRPAPRISPEPVPEPEPQADTAPDVQEAVEPEPSPDALEEADPQEAEAPEAASTEIVTEAEEPSRAPSASMRPQTRPNRPTPQPEPEPEAPAETQTAAAPEPEPEPTPEPEPAPEPEPDQSASETSEPLEDGIESALAEALGGGGTTDPEPDVPVGPPMTAGEKDALRLAVQSCWVVDVGSQAANVTVVVGMDMARDGTVVQESMRLVSSSGGEGAAVETAYQSARRAILRCQRGGYDLPPEKYDQWDELEISFDPSGMRIR